eukprot:CAMPEP_0181217654 /NCGR_PEP_ID=MMETSP1096-20121128/27268_1 /TAXON_ID=156174 ORGANISM="Chrysochromulina ericina, Strain CCMP281" /NCGR_SAMPLE_ID=MMETSP1096 /ASSEMBLY_ACC=CAM_ASM_000453 /LENGTH=355 /DNA_ID=CAMNT_0023309803 /DNA_START=1743 /DNA_END=2810 /DNA_ORIENTATION=-
MANDEIKASTSMSKAVGSSFLAGFGSPRCLARRSIASSARCLACASAVSGASSRLPLLAATALAGTTDLGRSRENSMEDAAISFDFCSRASPSGGRRSPSDHQGPLGAAGAADDGFAGHVAASSEVTEAEGTGHVTEPVEKSRGSRAGVGKRAWAVHASEWAARRLERLVERVRKGKTLEEAAIVGAEGSSPPVCREGVCDASASAARTSKVPSCTFERPTIAVENPPNRPDCWATTSSRSWMREGRVGEAVSDPPADPPAIRRRRLSGLGGSEAAIVSRGSDRQCSLACCDVMERQPAHHAASTPEPADAESSKAKSGGGGASSMLYSAPCSRNSVTGDGRLPAESVTATPVDG